MIQNGPAGAADGAVFRKAIFISENSICSRWFDEAR